MNIHREKYREARYWTSEDGGVVVCGLCPHRCRLKEGCDGFCRVRGVRDGSLMALAYGSISSAHIDPVEKKPLYHYHPGAFVYSIGGWGCNFRCVFCQNWSISQRVEHHGAFHEPSEVIRKATEAGCELIAYTYNEPLVGFEFVRDCCRRAGAAGLKNILVTNGYVSHEPAGELLPLVDALNVDIKSMEGGFYKRQCGGQLEYVLDFVKQACSLGCHVEITNLVIPGLNDGEQDFESLAQWISGELGQYTPLHLSAYHPDFKANYPPTSAATLRRAAVICRKRLAYVYLGNLPGREGQTTFCPGCGADLVIREGYRTTRDGLENGRCRNCGRPADIVG